MVDFTEEELDELKAAVEAAERQLQADDSEKHDGDD